MMSTSPIGTSPLHVCNACQQYTIKDDDDRVAHYKSEWHRYNVKRRCAGLSSISRELFETQLAALQSKKQEEAADRAKQRCTYCNKTFVSASSFQAHTASKKHLKRVKEVEARGAAAVAAEPDSDGTEEEEKESPEALASSTAALSIDGAVEDAKDDEDMAGGDEEEGTPIPVKTCLFCNRQFETIEGSVDHMLKIHGFFIPFVENLTDLNGMLEYLGEKVGVGHMCLWCNTRGRAYYPSTTAVQAHMSAKSHCKIRLEDEEDEAEFEEFYTFPGSEDEQEMETEATAATGDKAADGEEKSTALVATTEKLPRRPRGMAGINDLGELVLHDGSIIGHRQHNKVYRQSVRPSTDTRIVHISQTYRSYAQQSGSAGNGSTAIELHRSAKARFAGKEQHADWLQKKQQDTHRRLHLKEGMAKNLQKHYRAQVNF